MDEVRGRGLLVAIEFKDDLKYDGNTFSDILLRNGILARASLNKIMRFSPALVINEDEVNQSSEIIAKSLRQFEQLNQ